jgi:hypothetical protein
VQLSNCNWYNASQIRLCTFADLSAGNALALNTVAFLPNPLPHIPPRCVLDDLELAAFGAFAWGAGGDLFARLRRQPLDPVRPPASGVFGGGGGEVFEAFGEGVVRPVLVLVRVGRVDDAGDVAAAGEDEADRAGEVARELP